MVVYLKFQIIFKFVRNIGTNCKQISIACIVYLTYFLVIVVTSVNFVWLISSITFKYYIIVTNHLFVLGDKIKYNRLEGSRSTAYDVLNDHEWFGLLSRGWLIKRKLVTYRNIKTKTSRNVIFAFSRLLQPFSWYAFYCCLIFRTYYIILLVFSFVQYHINFIGIIQHHCIETREQ